MGLERPFLELVSQTLRPRGADPFFWKVQIANFPAISQKQRSKNYGVSLGRGLPNQTEKDQVASQFAKMGYFSEF